jgi:hypothetical protein
MSKAGVRNFNTQDYPKIHHLMHSKSVMQRKLDAREINKMSEIKTVTHEGQVYQIDKPYLFLNTNKKWEFGYLTKVNSTSQFPFINHLSEDFISIKCLPVFSGGFGTITPAPIELIDGAAYTFDYHKNRKPAIGVYSKSENTFITVGHDYFVFDCTNIRLMTVGSE